MASFRLIGAVHAKTVKRRRPDLRHVAVEHLIGSLGKLKAASFASALSVEEADLDARGIR